MEYKVLYRKYRPQDFDSIVGQDHVVKLLKNSIIDDKISHAYIFTGPRGTGKTSSAKIFAKAINCLKIKDGNPCNSCDMCTKINENPDIVEIDAASNNGVDDVRELIDNVRLAPSISKYKVYIIDEFHMLTTSAFNALLLTLEEPPSNVVFILATTDIQSVPITILSRCQRFDFKPITNENIIDRLKFVSKKEKIKITDDAIKEISYMSNGGMRDALSILDQISTKDGKIDIDDIVSNFGSISESKIEKLIDLYSKKSIKEVLNLLNEFKNDGIDYRILTTKLINSFKKILIDIRLGQSDYDFDFNDIYDLIFELSGSISNTRNTIDPYIFIEVILLKYVDNKKILKEEMTSNSEQIVESNIKKETIIENTKDEKIDNDSKNNECVDEVDTNNDVDLSTNDSDNNLNFSVDIRINNTFANAKKEYLSKIKEKWNDFIIYESNANKKLMSYILDTEIVVASDSYAILVNKLDSTVSLINEYITTLENDFKGFYGEKYKLVCLNDDDWNEHKNKYVFNIKNKIKYSIIEEVEEGSDSLNNIKPNDDTNDELETLAAEIFDNNVEIK